MNHHSGKELITRYVSGDLTGSSKEELEEHIRGCHSCRVELSIARSLEGILMRQPLVPAPKGLKDRIMRSTGALGESFLTVLNDRLIRLRRKYIRREEILRLVAVSAAVILLSFFTGEGYDTVASVVSNISVEDLMKTCLSKFGTVDGGFNITCFYPVLAALSLIYGLVSISEYLNPRFTRRVFFYLRFW